MQSLTQKDQFNAATIAEASVICRSIGCLPELRLIAEASVSAEYCKFLPIQLRPKLRPDSSAEASAESWLG